MASSFPVPVELLVPLVVCLVLLGGATAAQRALKDERHPQHRHLRSVRIAQYVLSWYLISIGFTLWNKYVLRYWRGTGFPFPIFVTCLHMTTKLVLTRVVNRCCTRPEKRIKMLPLREALRGPVPIGVCTAIDVAFSNLSFLFISVTFYTILKSSAILWILAWAVLLRLESLTWQLVAICGLVSTGVSLASYGEAAFSWLGFLLVTGACASSGLRWGLTQIMLEGKADIGDDSASPGHYRRSSSLGLRDPHRHQAVPTETDASTSSSTNGGNGGGGGGGGQRGFRPPEVELCDPTAATAAALAAAPAAGGTASSPPPAQPPPLPPQVVRHHAQHPHHHHHHHHHKPLEILYHVSPASALSCLPVFLIFELRPCLSSPFLATPALAAELLAVLTLGGCFSFLLILAEMKLVKISSSLTMSMFGAVKEVITVAISMLAFHDDVSLLNVGGLLLAIAGAVWYRQYKLHGGASPQAAAIASRGGSLDSAQSQYLPAESGIFHIEDEEEEEEEDILANGDEEGNLGRGAGRGGAGVQELQIVERALYRDVRLT